MRRIGIFGGSFNPIHVDIWQWLKKVIDQGLVDEVWLMVSPQNPLKQTASDLAPEQDRLALTRAAVEDFPHIVAADFEMQLPRPSYTWRTMELCGNTTPNMPFRSSSEQTNWVKFLKMGAPR